MAPLDIEHIICFYGSGNHIVRKTTEMMFKIVSTLSGSYGAKLAKMQMTTYGIEIM